MSSTPAELLTEWLGPVAGPVVYEYLTTTVKKSGSLRWPDADDEILATVVPRFHSPAPTRAGAYFDIAKVDHFVSFCRVAHHVKGKYARAGKRLELDFWQIIFVAAPLFGWRKADGTRLFSTLYEETAKKSGKSTFAAILALYLLTADGEPGAEVVCAAGDKDQARAVFDVAVGMTTTSKWLSKRIRPLRNQITYEHTRSWFKVLSAEGDTKAGLNLHGAIIDELLVQKGRTLVDNLENATAAREQPIVAYVTTAGIDDPGSIYTEKRDYAEKVSTGVLVDPSWLVAIWTLDDADDWRDEKVWHKSNPGIGKSVSMDYLRKRCAQAIASPSAQNTFLRDHMNVRTGQHTRWLDVNRWDQSGSQWVYPQETLLRGAIGYCGLDLASTTDLAALSIIVPEWVPNPENPDELIETLCWFLRAWTPEDTVDERERRDRAPYRQWVNEGLLIATPGNVIDYDSIEEEAFKIADYYEMRRLHFDRWGSKQILQHLQEGGLDVFEMGQGFGSMSPAMKEAERLVLERRVRHCGNPLLRYAVQSLAAKQDPAGNIKPDRDKSTGRIDPWVSGIMGIDAWARDSSGVSAYEVTSETA